MSLIERKQETLKEIVDIIESWTDRDRETLLRQLKMKKALRLARKIDKNSKLKQAVSDKEIADIVHDFRNGK